jgi:hypothetical protein
MNLEFIENNHVAISFFTCFNIFTTAFYYRGSFEDYERTILAAIAVYEFANIFIELNNHYKRAEKQIVLYVAHHIISAFSTGAFYFFYRPTTIFHDIVKCATYICCTNFYLNLQYCFPKVDGFKILFSLMFFYYRIILIFPYFIKIVRGDYYIENSPILSIIVCSIPLLFYTLNVYWGAFIINKIKNKIKTIILYCYV